MELSGHNLYRTGSVIQFDDGESILHRERISYEASEGDYYHTVVDGDRLDLIAHKRYKRKIPNASKYWWIIADVNNIYNPLDLESLIGTDILIPDIFKVLLTIQNE